MEEEEEMHLSSNQRVIRHFIWSPHWKECVTRVCCVRGKKIVFSVRSIAVDTADARNAGT
jgi:hypothetical protein